MAERSVAPKSFVPEESFLTEEERRDYGDDLLNVVGKRAREETRQLEAELQRLKKDVERVTEQTALSDKEKMYQYLDQRTPNWRDTNTNQEFLEWLGQIDMFSGQSRMAMLKQAYSQNDGARVAAFFGSFDQEAAAVAPKPKASDQPKAQTPRVSLDQLAAPGRAMSAAPVRPADEPEFISRAQIAAFYADKANGKYRGRQAEADAMERRIADAARDGRIPS